MNDVVTSSRPSPKAAESRSPRDVLAVTAAGGLPVPLDAWVAHARRSAARTTAVLDKGAHSMMPADLSYALSDDRRRAALNRDRAERLAARDRRRRERRRRSPGGSS